MTERERAAAGLLEAELEMQRAVAAQLRGEPGSRQRLARAKLRMHHAQRRAERALGIREPGPAIPDFGLGRVAKEAAREACEKNRQTPLQ